MAAGSAGHHLPRSDWDEGWEHLEGTGLGHRGQESPVPFTVGFEPLPPVLSSDSTAAPPKPNQICFITPQTGQKERNPC